MSRCNAMLQSFDESTVLGKPAMFTPVRIDRDTVPQGYHLYEVRHDDDCQGDAVEISHSIHVNHWGSIITRDEIDLSPEGNLLIEPTDINYGSGDCRTMSEFISKYSI